MSDDELPDAVRRLIADRIDSIPELEALLLFRENRSREWGAEEAGKRLYVSTLVAAHILSVLCQRGFFASVGDRYRYEPESRELAGAVDHLAVAYSQHLVAVTQIIHSKPSQNVRDFANAFRLRRPK